MKKVLAHLFNEATIALTDGSEIEVNTYVGAVSAFTRVLTSRDGDFSSNFDKIFEDIITNTTLREIIFENPTIQASKGKKFGQLTKKVLYYV